MTTTVLNRLTLSPLSVWQEAISGIAEKLQGLISSHLLSTVAGASSSYNASATGTGRLRRNFKKNKFFFLPLAVIVILIIIMLVFTFRNASKASSPILGASDQRVKIEAAKASQDLNKTFTFPLKDSAGKQVSQIKYVVEKAELRNEIIVKGQKATSVEGRTFLIISLKITNSFNQSVQVNARDYIRLTVNGDTNEKLAPDIHNDPVDVQAISTKETRVGFPINDTDKDLVLEVGEINGSKTNIPLHLTK